MKKVKVFLLNFIYGLLLLLMAYCYFFEYSKSIDIKMAAMSLLSFSVTICILAKVNSRKVYYSDTNLSGELLKLNILLQDPSFLFLLVLPFGVLLNSFNVSNLFYIICSIAQVFLTTMLIISIYLKLSQAWKMTFLSCLPAAQFGYMILADKTLSTLMIFNPLGSFCFIEQAFANLWTTICYVLILILILIFFFVVYTKKEQRQINCIH